MLYRITRSKNTRWHKVNCLPLPRAGYLRLQRLGKDFFVIYNAHFNAEQDRLCIKVIGVPVSSRHCLANHIAAYSRWNLFYWFRFSELQSPWQNRLLSIQLSMNFQIKKAEICWESWLRRKRSATSTTDDLSCSRKPNFSTLYFKYCCIRRKLYHRQKQLWATPLISSFFYIRNTFLRPKNDPLRGLN